MVARILTGLIDVGALDAAPLDERRQPIDFSQHKLIAQRQAEEGIVLLANRDATLPLPQRLDRLLIVGEHVDHGVLCGGGSSAVTPIGSLQLPGTSIMGMDVAKVVQPSSLVTAIEEESGARDVVFVDGTDRQQVLAEARKADAVIVFAQEWRSEGLDAVGLALPDDQDALIAAIAGVNPATIVVIQSGGPVTMPWRDEVAAILAAWYPGSGGGPAVAGVLFGRVNPSGRLPVTFPASEAQLPRPVQIDPETTTSNPATPRKGGIIPLDYDIDGSDVGYRWFAREGHQPLFPFGFGLSYTTFALSGLRVQVDGRYTASIEVANTGTRAGAVVVQIYVARPGADGFVRRLAGFAKTTLAAGERRSLEIDLEPRILARYRVGGDAPGFAIEPGVYRVWAAQHAGDDGLSQDIEIDDLRRITP